MKSFTMTLVDVNSGKDVTFDAQIDPSGWKGFLLNLPAGKVTLTCADASVFSAALGGLVTSNPQLKETTATGNRNVELKDAASKQTKTFKALNDGKVMFTATGFSERHEVVISMSPPNTLLKAADDVKDINQRLAAACDEAKD
jgi:hypothetical protein